MKKDDATAKFISSTRYISISSSIGITRFESTHTFAPGYKNFVLTTSDTTQYNF